MAFIELTKLTDKETILINVQHIASVMLTVYNGTVCTEIGMTSGSQFSAARYLVTDSYNDVRTMLAVR